MQIGRSPTFSSITNCLNAIINIPLVVDFQLAPLIWAEMSNAGPETSNANQNPQHVKKVNKEFQDFLVQK